MIRWLAGCVKCIGRSLFNEIHSPSQRRCKCSVHAEIKMAGLTERRGQRAQQPSLKKLSPIQRTPFPRRLREGGIPFVSFVVVTSSWKAFSGVWLTLISSPPFYQFFRRCFYSNVVGSVLSITLRFLPDVETMEINNRSVCQNGPPRKLGVRRPWTFF